MSNTQKQKDPEFVKVEITNEGSIWIITINRPEVRNCVNRPTAELLFRAMTKFDSDPDARVAILTGSEGHFCAGADLKAVASGDPALANRLKREGPAPMGISRLQMTKPVVAAISGYAVAGGLELALWADIRVIDQSAIFGVYCRRFGVPLIDGGTVRLPRLIGQSRAMDMILSGRSVEANEALDWGLANRIAPQGQTALDSALTFAKELCLLPQVCMRNDRMSVLSQWGLSEEKAMREEFEYGLNTLQSGETVNGAMRFEAGEGRHGQQQQPSLDRR